MTDAHEDAPTAAEAELQRLARTPVDADGVNALAAGIVLWAVAGLVLALFGRNWLAAHDASWWLWVCPVGVGIGLLGTPYVLRRRRAYQGAAATNPPGASQE